MTDQILFDKLAYLDKLKAAGIDASQARAHADALDVALRESVATKVDITRLENRIDLAVRDITIRFGGMLIAAVAILIGVKFF